MKNKNKNKKKSKKEKKSENGHFHPVSGVFGRFRENLQKVHKKTWGHKDFKKFIFLPPNVKFTKMAQKIKYD